MIAIIGILIALLLPAVQAAREASRRALDQLARGALDVGPDLDVLTAEITRAVRALEDKVQRVTMRGKTLYERAPHSTNSSYNANVGNVDRR